MTLYYRNPQTHETIEWTVPIPCAPDVMHETEEYLAKHGFVREEKPE